ncbi:MAG: tetratricopeptide repeat protein [Myxococcales bacterium]|nr:tetratricopeptide repeat protein [Myxococcales bacterium]
MEQFGKYALVSKIGTGGMAEVYLARTTVAQGLAKILVIKKIHPAYAKSRQFVAMFVDEAKIALGLNHPNIVQVFDFGAVGDTYFLAMENVEGMDLLRLLQDCAKDRRRIPYGLAAYIVQQLGKGLDYAHKKTDEFGEALAIVHRDISPQNVLVSWDGGVKIVDFGIARARHVTEDEGVIKGKFAYMSPEQARGEPVDCRSDVWSAGIVLHELITGRPLFGGRGKEALEHIKSGAITPLRDVAPDVPAALERIVGRALAYHRDDRYPSARDLVAELGRFQLEWGHASGELVDSTALATFLATVIPAERRAPRMRPIGGKASGTGTPASPTTGSLGSLGSLGHVGDGGPSDRRAASTRELRERKYVYVVEGVIRGVAALERRLGAAGATKVVDEFRRVARDIAFKHDALEDRGERDLDSLRLVVGLPLASEDDAGRTIRLALALVDALDGIGSDVEPELRLAIGIQRGAATVIRRGASQSFEVEATTAGFASHLARFAGPAEILVGGRVFRSARSEWNFEALAAIDIPANTDVGAHKVDEDTEPGIKRARVYRLRGAKERAARLRDRIRPDALYGRELEQKRLRDAYRDALVSRRKRHLVIAGDHGVGKRSLVAGFLATIAPGEAYLLRTTTRVGTAMTPYGVLADLAREVLGLADGAEPHEVLRRLALAMPLVFPGEHDGREARAALAAVAVLLGVRTPDASDGDPDERRQRLLGLVARVEHRLEPDRPLIIVGEDVHWCDQESLEIFAALLKVPTARAVLGIVTTRPDKRILDAATSAGADVIHVDELDLEARRRLLASRFAPDDDVDELAEQILARSGGNPFFILEQLDALAEREIITPAVDHPGRYRWTKRDAALQVPTSVEDLLITRIDRLPEREKQTLLIAAVHGRFVAPPALAALLGRQVTGELDELVRRGLLLPHEGEYRFKNDTIMTVAYGLVPSEDKTRVHRRIADRIATGPSYRPGADDAHVARHLELAGDAIPSAERYLRAATHAIDVGGNADAFRQLTRALKLLPPGDHARRFQARRQREEILRRLARRPQQLRELSAMRKEAEAIGDPQKQALAHALLAQFYIDVGKAPAAQRAVAPALQFARDAGDKLAEADALRLRSAIARLVGNNDDSLKLCEQALALASETGDGTTALLARALILNDQGTTLWNMGRLEQAIEAYAEALVIYRALKLPRQEARALNNMGIVFSSLGEYEEALAHYKSSLKIDQQLGDRSGVALKLGNIGQAYGDLGDLDRAESYLAKAWKLGEQTGDPSSMADAAISWGQAKLNQGDVAGALELLERGKDLASENRERFQEIRGLEYIALAQLEAGQAPAGALELARSATELARKMPMMVGVIHGLAISGLAQLRLGDHAAAIAATSEAVALLDRQARPEGAEHIWYWHALTLAGGGQRAQAQAALARAATEITAKAARLRDPALKAAYLASKTARAVAAARGLD